MSLEPQDRVSSAYLDFCTGSAEVVMEHAQALIQRATAPPRSSSPSRGGTALGAARWAAPSTSARSWRSLALRR